MRPAVLMVGNFLSATKGVRFVCEDLAEQLQRQGWFVITTSDQPGRVSRLLDMLLTAWAARRSYAIAQVDVYSGPSFFWAEVVCWLLRRLGKPYVLTLHGGNLPPFARRWPWRVRHLLRSAHAVTTPSRYLLEQMQPYCSDLVLLPNPLALAAYPFRLRRAPRPRLVWLRSFHAIYNPSMAVQVVAQLASDFPDISLTMIGPDRHDGSLDATRALAEQLGVADRVSMAGPVAKTDVPHWLQDGDIFINTTNADNTPVSVLEALACGLCVVTTNVGGIPYLVADDQQALLVPPDDSTAMAAAVRQLLTTPELAARLSGEGHAYVQQFDWGTVLPQWHTLLREMIK